jgi:hypothetical protein
VSSSGFLFKINGMSANATITGDCKYISLVLSGAQGAASVLISNGGISHSFNVTLPANEAAYHTVVSLEAVSLSSDGIFEITVTDSAGTIHEAGTFGKCSLNCCIAKKVDSLLGCDCDCKKCDAKLITAERVLLLITGIETDLAQLGEDSSVNAGLFENAKKKYNKALELCSDSCGCSC